MTTLTRLFAVAVLGLATMASVPQGLFAQSVNDPASPTSPTNPLNPLNPLSPTNPLNWDSGEKGGSRLPLRTAEESAHDERLAIEATGGTFALGGLAIYLALRRRDYE